MSENTIRPRSRAFCDVERCKHCENKRCDVRTLKDVDYFTVTDPNKCVDYEARLAKQFAVSLDEDEMTALMTLLGPSSDEGEPNEELCNKLYDVSQHNPIAANMYFINIYDRDQQYGGPEEGGWWFHTMLCEYSLGYDCVDWNQIGVPDFRYLIDMFIEQVQTNFDEADILNKPDLKEDIARSLTEHDYYEVAQLDHYGVGRVVAIERQPGARHNTRRQYYC
jgi:hypothetical protein